MSKNPSYRTGARALCVAHGANVRRGSLCLCGMCTRSYTHSRRGLFASRMAQKHKVKNKQRREIHSNDDEENHQVTFVKNSSIYIMSVVDWQILRFR
jgi:anthranilate/para-aminobenzoate synthase component II